MMKFDYLAALGSISEVEDSQEGLRGFLEHLYTRLNRYEYLNPDPLEIPREYPDVKDREIVALISACLSYGRVKSIIRGIRQVMSVLQNPYDFLVSLSDEAMTDAFVNFRYRFTSGKELSWLLSNMKRILRDYPSLEACYEAGQKSSSNDSSLTLERFVSQLNNGNSCRKNTLLASPVDGSACKRFHLFLRWMVRKDAIDPGGWDSISPDTLIVPLDVHMFAICTALGLTKRKSPDRRTAIEITNAFRAIAPTDPVKYDFALTRLGIRGDLHFEPELFKFYEKGDFDGVKRFENREEHFNGVRR